MAAKKTDYTCMNCVYFSRYDNLVLYMNYAMNDDGSMRLTERGHIKGRCTCKADDTPNEIKDPFAYCRHWWVK